MTNLQRLKNRTGSADETLLDDMLFTAKTAILSRRFPYKAFSPEEVENAELEWQYRDLEFRIALDLFNKQGAEGETEHTANGIKRVYESSWISDQLLSEVVPFCGVTV